MERCWETSWTLWNLDYEKFTIIWTFCKFGTYKTQHPYYLFPCTPHLWIYIYYTHTKHRNLKVLYNDWYLIISVEAWYKKDNNFFTEYSLTFPFEEQFLVNSSNYFRRDDCNFKCSNIFLTVIFPHRIHFSPPHPLCNFHSTSASQKGPLHPDIWWAHPQVPALKNTICKHTEFRGREGKQFVNWVGSHSALKAVWMGLFCTHAVYQPVYSTHQVAFLKKTREAGMFVSCLHAVCVCVPVCRAKLKQCVLLTCSCLCPIAVIHVLNL